MKWGLMGVAFFQIAFVALCIGANLKFQNDPILGEVLLAAGILAIVNGVVPILRSKRLDDLHKRKMALLIFVGFAIQLVAMVVEGTDPAGIVGRAARHDVADHMLFWFGELVGLVGIAISYWYHISVMPFKKWLSAETS